jgi:hypothetical protein
MSGWQIAQFGDYQYRYGEEQAYIRRVATEDWTALDGPTSNATMRKIRGIERATEGPFTWRRYGQPWRLERVEFEQAEASTAPAVENPSLFLVLQSQADGEPDHWSLSIASESQGGDVYQVKGDAENMHHEHEQNTNIFRLTSYKTSYTLIHDLSPNAEALVKYYAEAEAPPSAPNRAAVKENCQGWTYRVLARLAEKGIMSQDMLPRIQELMEPIN